MALTRGTRIGPYEVTTLIGEGGMGKVWPAHHTALNRDDALKVLPEAFASDPDRLARFRREAQVLASLNHSETLASVLAREPDWTALPATVSPAIRALLRRCLDKDRHKRIGDIAAARFAIEEAGVVGGAGSTDEAVVQSRIDAAVATAVRQLRRIMRIRLAHWCDHRARRWRGRLVCYASDNAARRPARDSDDACDSAGDQRQRS